MNDLTDAEIAEMRAEAQHAQPGVTGQELARLLDEVERRRTEDRAIAATLDAPESPEQKAALDEMTKDPAEVLRRARARAAASDPERVRALLERIEWSADVSGDQYRRGESGCPECGGIAPRLWTNPDSEQSPAPLQTMTVDHAGHEPGCELSALLGAT